MCTLSLVTRDNGYLLGMNRDERIARGAGVPPEALECNGTKVIYPSDSTGSTSILGTSILGTSISETSISKTWIGVNEHAIALALLNWNDVAPRPTHTVTSRSRGLVIPALISSRSLAQLRGAFGCFGTGRDAAISAGRSIYI